MASNITNNNERLEERDFLHKRWGEGMESKWISLAGLAGTAITLIIAVAVPYLQRETSELSVTVVSKANLNPVMPDGFRPQVSLSIDGKQVQLPHYSVIEVANSGSRAILAEAVEEPLKIRLRQGVIVSAEVISARACYELRRDSATVAG